MQLAGLTDIVVGLFMFFSGWGDWYYTHFHIFGVFGMTAITYGAWHQYLYMKETGERIWKKISKKNWKGKQL